jgi:hypothetical protein
MVSSNPSDMKAAIQEVVEDRFIKEKFKADKPLYQH